MTKDVKGQAMSFAEALTKAVPGKLIQVTISTNQDNGVPAGNRDHSRNAASTRRRAARFTSLPTRT